MPFWLLSLSPSHPQLFRLPGEPSWGTSSHGPLSIGTGQYTGQATGIWGASPLIFPKESRGPGLSY